MMSYFSSSSNSSNRKTGEAWTSKVYFDPNADEEGPLKEITDRNLRDEMERVIEGEERIQKIWVYKCPLFPWQLTMFVLNHQFVVIETEKWWWSIEKNSEGITIQRGRNLSSVKDRYKRSARKGKIKEIITAKGGMRMKDLVDWLYLEDELHKEYYWLTKNCKNFAQRVFDGFAASKSHYTLTSKVYFDPNVDEGKPFKGISEEHLRNGMEKVIEREEKIQTIWVYKSPLSPWQLTMFVLNHQFVVIKTEKWWWSIEKNSEGITIQRGGNLSSVRDRYRRNDRNTDIERMSRDVGRMKMKDFVAWLYLENELHKKYHWRTENSKDFAKRVFDKFAASKCHSAGWSIFSIIPIMLSFYILEF